MDFNLRTLVELIIFIWWLYLLWVVLSRRRKPGTDGGGDTPPITGTKRVAIGLDPASGRWQLRDPGSEQLALPIVVKRGEVATWENTTGNQIDLQFPSNALFVAGGSPNSGGEPIDDWIVTLSPGATLQVPISRDAPIGAYTYALWVRGEGSVTGYAQGGSPPRIIVEKA